MSVYEYEAVTLEGKPVSLGDYRGSVLLIVNTASACGLTPQYEGLQQLYDQYKDRGLTILGFPCNQFGQQEPGTHEEIQTFCSRNYGVTFPMFAKIDVRGAEAHPLFRYLTGGNDELVPWNFTKFLINREGQPVKRFEPQTVPGDLKAEIEALL